MKLAHLAVLLSLAGCNKRPADTDVPQGPAPAAVPLPKSNGSMKCVLPKLDFRTADILTANDRGRFTANFREAFDKACAEGLMADAPLIDPDALAKDTLVVMNAPEANVTSIYFGPSAAPPAMLLESPFGDPPKIPSAEDLHEAIFCATKGASELEQEELGRCLPD